MKSDIFISILVLGLGIGAVDAQSGAWGQCGGIGYTGPTTCVSGYGCKYLNDYYWQCIPSNQLGTSTTTTTTVKSTTTSARSSTTLSTTSRTSTTSSRTTTQTSPTSPSRTSTTTTTRTTTTSSKSTTASSSRTATPTPGIKYWFSFGDSYTQTGFNPNGIQPSTGNPMGNPPYPGWTSAGGPNWIGVATTKYNRSLTLTYNFAYGGATIDAALVTPYTSTVLSLTDQTNQFLSTYASGNPSWTASNTLFSVFIGINDIANSWWRPNWLTFIDTLLTAEFALVAKMYDVGGRKFLISNIPAIERSPMMLADSQASRDALKAALALWSTKLQTYITNFQATHSGTTFWFYDSYADYNYVLDHPSLFGMNPNIALFGSDPTYAWYNDFHPGVIIQDYMGKRVDDLLVGFW
ncbi:hypothetical protein DRE_06745 [Drechslerella stenobrocha 248]|uniref:CBM1 domain-containing protein n=1 Tax=Drechslerella stenobrocha 248 TaxID=1043628 RepID=W7HWP9_9PEZI|nr:hypothetical protein DRE_06745 [Drechslerella stenobrocha 248]